MGEQELVVEYRGGVAVLTLNRPERRNALSPSLMDDLVEGILLAERDPAVSVVLIRAEGPAFCGGYDMADYGTTSAREGHERTDPISDVQYLRSLNHRWRRVSESPIPVLAAVQGYCVAGGMDLVLHTDLVICSRSARFGYPPVRSQGSPGASNLIERIGLQWAKRLYFTGDTLSGETAARIGLALEVVDNDELDERSFRLARRVAHIDKTLLMAHKLSLDTTAAAAGLRAPTGDLGAAFSAVAHAVPRAEAFRRQVVDEGLRSALKERNAPFAPDEPI